MSYSITITPCTDGTYAWLAVPELVGDRTGRGNARALEAAERAAEDWIKAGCPEQGRLASSGYSYRFYQDNCGLWCYGPMTRGER